ncbi:conserved hypothetical protein [Roseibium sp. TrichSKD4]|uniref:hypothetical protein n=1 Tax=Roseibium sp. TrichSKD4 TaxID=744980 RepID=UPI0001E56CCD|nr:hypothetical protein [Roseibium sp. TrichSKD4]EFO32120.1 conserved hypothetical protein [Roseibium sp. TrichSKD4]
MARKAPFPETVGSAEMAKLLGVTTRRLTQLVKEGVLVKEGRGSFSVCECIQAFTDFKVRTSVEQAAPSAAEKVHQRIEQILARKLARDDRELISLEEAIDAFEDISGQFLVCLSGLPSRLGRNDLQERRRIEKILDVERERLSGSFTKRALALRAGVAAFEADEEDDA